MKRIHMQSRKEVVMNRKQIIAITVLGILMLVLGCKSKSSSNELKPISQKDIVGTYEWKNGSGLEGEVTEIHIKLVFINNGLYEVYAKEDASKPWMAFAIFGGKWSIADNKVHAESKALIGNQIDIAIYRINPDNSITDIVLIRGGKRADIPKELQKTFKKIK